MQVKFISGNGNIVEMNETVLKQWGMNVDVVIDELVEITDLSINEAYYIAQALRTRYGDSLIETIINNPKFDLRTFMRTMKLEDIIAKKPSKILLSAQSTKYHEDRMNPEDIGEYNEEVFRIITREQAEMIKQCIKKNKYYNFMGATDENHGFDIETFGLDFISQLDYGLNEYTYEAINKNLQLVEQIKSNPQVAQYVAQAVNEHIKIRKNIEGYNNRDKSEYNRYTEVEYYLEYDADSYGQMEREEREWILKQRQEDKQREMFQKKYSTYEEDMHDSEIWFNKRMRDLEEMYEKGNIEIFEPINVDDLNFVEYGSFEKNIIKLETLREGNALEYLKKSGRNRFKVKDKKKDLYLEQDEILNLQNISDLEIEHPTASTQLIENVIEEKKTFFKKIIDKIRRFFNKKSPSTVDENLAYDSRFKKRQKDFLNRNKVLEDELLKQDKQEGHNKIKALEEKDEEKETL